MHIGQGFHRDTGEVADHGIKFEKVDEPSWTCDPKAFLSCLETSKDYIDMLTAGNRTVDTASSIVLCSSSCL